MSEFTELDRRSMLGILGATTVATVGGAALGQPERMLPGTGGGGGGKVAITPERLGWDAGKGEFVLPALPYDKAALEPHVDAQTMEVHHGRHHKAYVDGLNKALGELKKIRESGGDVALVKHWSREVSFHAAGHVNHCLFWLMMAPAGRGGGGQPSGKLADAITRDFGSFDQFVTHFKAAAAQVEGGGWAWLMADPVCKRLFVHQAEKQQDMYVPGWRPILGVDVWEHAYYLKYQNRRADYVSAWMNVVNWGVVQDLFERAVG
jgi:Fe-Mn family superoxide dismutase